MNFTVIVIAVIFVLLAGLAGFVVIRDRRNKEGCVGCPYRDKCPKKEYDEDVGDDN